MGYVLRKIYYETYITLLNSPKSKMAEHYIADSGWFGLAWPDSAHGRSQEMTTWEVKDIRSAKRLASLWAPKMAPNFSNVHYQIGLFS